ncbi:MAG TPA: hypothetical protein DE191_07275 [Enterobacter sp.]|nr:hypothetical protein [Enterobacter sp.]
MRCRPGRHSAAGHQAAQSSRGRLCVTRLFYGEIKERNSREKVQIPNKCGDLQNRIAENNILPIPHVISLHRPTRGRMNKE